MLAVKQHTRKLINRKQFVSGFKSKYQSSKTAQRSRIIKAQLIEKKRKEAQRIFLKNVFEQIDSGFSKHIKIGGVPAHLKLKGRSKTKGYIFDVFTEQGEPLNMTIEVSRGSSLN